MNNPYGTSRPNMMQILFHVFRLKDVARFFQSPSNWLHRFPISDGLNEHTAIRQDWRDHIRNVLEVTGRGCYNVSGTSWRLPPSHPQTHRQRSMSFMWSCIYDPTPRIPTYSKCRFRGTVNSAPAKTCTLWSTFTQLWQIMENTHL